MKICFLSAKHPPFDKRVFDKEACSLARAGFDVTHIAPMEPDQERSQMRSGVRIIGYPEPKDIADRILQIPRLVGLARGVNADCYHCNEVDSWISGVILKLLDRSLVVFDVHEHYPSTFSESRFPKVIRPLVASGIRMVFKALVPFTDGLVMAKKSVAVDFRGIGARRKTIFVENFTPVDALSRAKSSQAKTKSSKGPVTAIHLGLISKMRGWPQLLEAMSRMDNKRMRLKIIGTFNDGSRGEFEQMAGDLRLNERIEILDWMPFAEAQHEIFKSDIGLVLFQPGIQNHVYALPHKMFDYMAAGLPVVAPLFAEEVAPIIHESQCGILVDSADPTDIAACLDRLCGSRRLRTRMGKAGVSAVLAHYNWENEACKLTAMYRRLEDKLPMRGAITQEMRGLSR